MATQPRQAQTAAGATLGTDATAIPGTMARVAPKLSHPRTAGSYAFGETPERVLWIAMEYIEGEGLHNVLAKEQPRQVGELLLPVADLLDRAGTLGIIHRDVKPDNIIVAPDG